MYDQTKADVIPYCIQKKLCCSNQTIYQYFKSVNTFKIMFTILEIVGNLWEILHIWLESVGSKGVGIPEQPPKCMGNHT